MHRVRQSLPYFKEYGWEPVVITVEESCIEVYSRDPLLLHTIPEETEVHRVKAWDVNKTRKYGLGSLSMRSYYYFLKKGDELLSQRTFDLVYFSTTAFHVMALGRRWKRKFGVPFVLDIQDPWRNDFYLTRPRSERPPKFFIAYTIDKWLEAGTVPLADGIISVSKGYCDEFMTRYPSMRPEQFRVITFGASSYDFAIMEKYAARPSGVQPDPDKINIVYIGRGGHDMQFSLEIIFKALAKGLKNNPALFSRIHVWFIGTSYAPPGQGNKTILPLAEKYGAGTLVTEITDRMPYFETLWLLRKAGMVLVPGSTDTAYTASKIYPYILAKRPLLAVFHKDSSVVTVLRDIHFGRLVVFENTEPADKYVDECFLHFQEILSGDLKDAALDEKTFEPYTAKAMTLKQVEFFNEIVAHAG